MCTNFSLQIFRQWAQEPNRVHKHTHPHAYCIHTHMHACVILERREKRLNVLGCKKIHFNTRSEIFPQKSALPKLIVFSSYILCVHMHLGRNPPPHNSVKSPVKGLFARAGCCLVLDVKNSFQHKVGNFPPKERPAKTHCV